MWTHYLSSIVGLWFVVRAVFAGGCQGGLTPARGSWPPSPQKILQNLFGGSTLNPLRTPDSIFLLNQYIYLQLYAAYAFTETDVI